MFVNWQNLNKPGDELTDEMPRQSLTRVIRVLQEAGFCIYPSETEADGIAFIVPCAPINGFPQNYFSNN